MGQRRAIAIRWFPLRSRWRIECRRLVVWDLALVRSLGSAAFAVPRRVPDQLRQVGKRGLVLTEIVSEVLTVFQLEVDVPYALAPRHKGVASANRTATASCVAVVDDVNLF